MFNFTHVSMTPIGNNDILSKMEAVKTCRPIISDVLQFKVVKNVKASFKVNLNRKSNLLKHLSLSKHLVQSYNGQRNNRRVMAISRVPKP